MQQFIMPSTVVPQGCRTTPHYSTIKQPSGQPRTRHNSLPDATRDETDDVQCLKSQQAHRRRPGSAAQEPNIPPHVLKSTTQHHQTGVETTPGDSCTQAETERVPKPPPTPSPRSYTHNRREKQLLAEPRAQHHTGLLLPAYQQAEHQHSEKGRAGLAQVAAGRFHATAWKATSTPPLQAQPSPHILPHAVGRAGAQPVTI
jgi:hypothetical protein